MNRTPIFGDGSTPVQSQEHILIELKTAISQFKAYPAYTREQIIDSLERIQPYTTKERVNGMKQAAEIVTRCHNEAVKEDDKSWKEVIASVQNTENRKTEAERLLEENRKMYSSLKQRFQLVKNANYQLQRNNDSLKFRIEELEKMSDAREVKRLEAANNDLREENEKLKTLIKLYGLKRGI